jgi:hypothetical protein
LRLGLRQRTVGQAGRYRPHLWSSRHGWTIAIQRSMPDALAFKALSYGLIGILALAGLILSFVSLRREIICGKPPSRFSPVILIIAALCAFIALLTAYIHSSERLQIMLRWERAAVTSQVERHSLRRACPSIALTLHSLSQRERSFSNSYGTVMYLSSTR